MLMDPRPWPRMGADPNMLCCLAVVLVAAFMNLCTDFLIKANTFYVLCYMFII